MEKMHSQILKETGKKMQRNHGNGLSLLRAETESLACQEQSIATNYLKVRILKTGTDPKFRLCRTEIGTIDHVVSVCSNLAKKKYFGSCCPPILEYLQKIRNQSM